MVKFVCPTCGRRLLATVDNAPFRERFLELTSNGTSMSTVCRRMGWLRRDGKNWGSPDTRRLKKTLGLVPYNLKGKQGHVQRRITLDIAARLCEALELDPWEAGL